MSASVSVNGNEIKEVNGVFYINGNKVINNCISGNAETFNYPVKAFFTGFACGALFLILLVEIASAI